MLTYSDLQMKHPGNTHRGFSVSYQHQHVLWQLYGRMIVSRYFQLYLVGICLLQWCFPMHSTVVCKMSNSSSSHHIIFTSMICLSKVTILYQDVCTAHGKYINNMSLISVNWWVNRQMKSIYCVHLCKWNICLCYKSWHMSTHITTSLVHQLNYLFQDTAEEYISSLCC